MKPGSGSHYLEVEVVEKGSYVAIGVANSDLQTHAGASGTADKAGGWVYAHHGFVYNAGKGRMFGKTSTMYRTGDKIGVQIEDTGKDTRCVKFYRNGELQG